jgi:hypothetical protein
MSNPNRVEGTILLEGCEIVYKNFAGRESKFNQAGSRNFCVFIDDLELVDQLIEDGWNIKKREGREEGQSDRFYMQVTVSFKGRIPAHVYMITSRGKTPLDAETIELLDEVNFENVDLLINPYNWEARGDRGVSGYVKTMFVTIEEDVLERKYADLEEAAPEE